MLFLHSKTNTCTITSYFLASKFIVAGLYRGILKKTCDITENFFSNINFFKICFKPPPTFH